MKKVLYNLSPHKRKLFLQPPACMGWKLKYVESITNFTGKEFFAGGNLSDVHNYQPT